MKLSTLTTALLLAPVALCLAQPPKPAPPVTPAPAVQTPAPKPPPRLEDVPGTDTIVLRIGDETITRSQFERLLAAMPDQQKARAQTPTGKRQVAEQIVQLEAMAQEARKRGLDKTDQSKELIRIQTDSVLANALYRDLSANVKADDAAMKAYYDAHKADYEEVSASHILIRYAGSPVPLRTGQKDLTPDEALAKAQDLRKRILAGEDFAKLAASESDDVQSGQNGGSLGNFTHGRMVPAFEEAAFKQPVGELSEPIKTQFGYHLIKVTKHDTQAFDAVKPTIEQKMRPEMAQKAVDDVRKQTTVTMNEAYFGPATPPPAPAPAPVPPAPAK